MYKIINIFFLLIFFLFFIYIFNYYSSSKNIKKINQNRANINEIITDKVSNLMILKNDTSNVIEFNSSFPEDIKDNKPRSFWQLFNKQ
tara:strand:- start:7 stop:270 length:264 start_codon:yes stop_codon:yes gene_type:complete